MESIQLKGANVFENSFGFFCRCSANFILFCLNMQFSKHLEPVFGESY